MYRFDARTNTAQGCTNSCVKLKETMEEFALAIAFGVVGGIIGFAPFLVARSRIRAKLKSDGTGSIITGLAAVFISFFILILEIVLCRLLVQEYFLPFSFSAIVVFLLAVGVYVATLMRR